MLGLSCILYFRHSLFSFTFPFLVLFLSSFTFNSLFWFSWLLCSSCSPLFDDCCCVVPIFMDIVPFIPKINPRWFPFSSLTFISHCIYCRHSTNTHNVLFWSCIGGFTPLPLAARSGFSPTTCLATNFFPLLGKSQSNHYFSLSLNDKPSLISLVLTS